MAMAAEKAWLSSLLETSNSRIDTRDVDALQAALVARDVERGQVLIKAGETPPGLWIIRRGLVELVMVTHHRRRVVQLLREGEILGDSFLALGIDSPYTARAVERCELLFLAAGEFEDLLLEHPALAVAWLSNALGRLARSRTRVVEILGKTLRERVARLLVDEAVDAELHLPQKTLAEMLGVQRSSLNKVLRELEAAGYVSVGYSNIELRDEMGLRAVAMEGSSKTL